MGLTKTTATAKSLRSCPTLWPQRRQPTRLPRPWDSPGRNTGVGCHFLLQCLKVKSESEVAQSRPTLSNPMDCGLQPSRLLHPWEFSRQEYWSGVPSPFPQEDAGTHQKTDIPRPKTKKQLQQRREEGRNHNQIKSHTHHVGDPKLEKKTKEVLPLLWGFGIRRASQSGDLTKGLGIPRGSGREGQRDLITGLP